MSNNKELGSIGEGIACKYLNMKGLRIIHKNFSCKTGEIDIIATEKDTIAFIEVKTRTSDKFGKPYEAVSRTKQNKIVKTALWYMSQNRMFNYMSRFDIIEVVLDEERNYLVNYIKDAFQYTGRYGY